MVSKARVALLTIVTLLVLAVMVMVTTTASERRDWAETLPIIGNSAEEFQPKNHLAAPRPPDGLVPLPAGPSSYQIAYEREVARNQALLNENRSLRLAKGLYASALLIGIGSYLATTLIARRD